MARVFLACPHNGRIEWEVALALMQCTDRIHDVLVKPIMTSLLAFGFNTLWCEALNRRRELGLTHFAMLHSDVAPEPCWLDTLLAEQRRAGVDVLSCVTPIKDGRGLTSTGMLNPTTGQVRRLTLSEAHALPLTFTAPDTPEPESVLALNTGLWVCDFTKDWVEQVHFEIRDEIHRDEDGVFSARVMPEDWLFSAQLARLGVAVGATRAVHLSHYGRAEYTNDLPWGQPTDTGG
jgi:hypothetical protein